MYSGFFFPLVIQNFTEQSVCGYSFNSCSLATRMIKREKSNIHEYPIHCELKVSHVPPVAYVLLTTLLLSVTLNQQELIFVSFPENVEVLSFALYF